MKKLAVDRLFM